jgi:hypothetical protein
MTVQSRITITQYNARIDGGCLHRNGQQTLKIKAKSKSSIKPNEILTTTQLIAMRRSVSVFSWIRVLMNRTYPQISGPNNKWIDIEWVQIWVGLKTQLNSNFIKRMGWTWMNSWTAHWAAQTQAHLEKTIWLYSNTEWSPLPIIPWLASSWPRTIASLNLSCRRCRSCRSPFQSSRFCHWPSTSFQYFLLFGSSKCLSLSAIGLFIYLFLSLPNLERLAIWFS